MPFPSSVDANKFSVAAFHNFDNNEGTLFVIGSSHDIIAVMFHRKTDSQQEKVFYAEHNCQNSQNFMEPTFKPK